MKEDILNSQFKILNNNLKTRLKAINKYDEESLNLLFYKFNKQLKNLSIEEINSLKKSFEKEINTDNYVIECCIDSVNLEDKKIKKSFKEKLKDIEDKISNIVEFREEALLGLFSFFLFVWFLLTGLFNIQLIGKILSFVITIIFLATLDKFKKKNKISGNEKLSSALKSLIFMIGFSLVFCFMPRTSVPQNFQSPSYRVSALKFFFKI